MAIEIGFEKDARVENDRPHPVATPPRTGSARLAGETVVYARDVSMRYGRNGPDALKDVSIDVARGEVVGILGPNGAGKTTLVEILEGYRERSRGTVEILGEDPARAGDAWRAQIGVVLQSWRDHPRWKVGELIAHIATYYPDPRDVEEVIALVDLGGQVGQPAQSLSGGQRRRLDIALGIIGRPRILFLDEPTAGLDPEIRREVQTVIARLARDEQVAVLLTTHDLSEAERLATRILMLHAGRVLATGTVAELRAQVTGDAEIRWTEDGEPRVLHTSDPSGDLWRMHRERQGPIADIEVHRPTLEDTYFRLMRAAEGEQQ